MKNLNQKTAVILCGGKGSRLGLLSKKIPKSMVKINNYPIIWFIIKNLIIQIFQLSGRMIVTKLTSTGDI